MTVELGFLGAGNMAEAIARAAIDRGVLPPDRMAASDPNPERRTVFEGLGIRAVEHNVEVIRDARQVMLAVKPQVMSGAAADIAEHGAADQVVISIMAGITTEKLAEAIGRPARIVRVMPNTPVQVGMGMAGVALSAAAEPGDEDLTMRLFNAAGRAIVVQEQAIDAITAVSGSGPAYVFYLAEAMHAAAVKIGLGEHADLLVRQTIRGAAELLAGSDLSPAELRRRVTSPGGTTEAAIKHLDGNQTHEVVINAIKAAQARSVELGR